MTGGDLAAAMPAVARALLGEPVAGLSTAKEWRYGRRGSLAVNVERGLWRDHEAGTGGGVVALIRRERGGDTADALQWLGGGVGRILAPSARAHAGARSSRNDHDSAEKSAYALAIWREAASPHGSPAETYLASRGLHLGLLGEPPGDRVRFAAQCPFGRGVRSPVMLALLTDIAGGAPVGIRRTALTTSGARASDDGTKLPHKALGRSGNAVARLSGGIAAPRELALCEGIETGLSVAAATGATVWACPAGTLARMPVLPGVERLTIFADNDAPGLAAARLTATRWRAGGRDADIQTPCRAGADFNDLWMEGRNG